MSSPAHHVSGTAPEHPSAPSHVQLDLCETDPLVADSTEEPTRPHSIYQTQPKYLRQSTEQTLDLYGRRNENMTFQTSHQSTIEGSNCSSITARNVEVDSIDNHSLTEGSGNDQSMEIATADEECEDISLVLRLYAKGYISKATKRCCAKIDEGTLVNILCGDYGPSLSLTPRISPIVKGKLLPDGWEEDIHPEGLLLYSTVLTVRTRRIRVHTDLALRRFENHSIIARALDRFSKLAHDCNELHDSDCEDSDIEACIVVSEKFPDDFGYYLANHRSQTIFWLEDIQHKSVEGMGLSALDSDILQLKLEALYWRHVQLEYCDDSTAPKDGATLARLETFWRQAKKQRDQDCTRVTCNWMCGRLWYDFVTARVVNHWGTDYVRLERTTIVGDDSKPSQNAAPPLIEWLCILFLWNEPAVTMKLLDEAWLGGVVYQKPWRKMMDTFSNEWEKIFVLSAIIFAGAMAFLAVPVQNSTGNTLAGSEPSIITSLAFLCGILCCVFSVASLIAAVNLKRDFGGNIRDDVYAASEYLQSLNGGVMGYLKWGIYLSLPRALFQWAVSLVILAYQLHEERTQFFWTEVAVTGALAAGVIAVRRLAPDRIRPESIFKDTGDHYVFRFESPGKEEHRNVDGGRAAT
ncbi:hypothetical protein M407DRAFT_27836 [Tulasnella calospora MUT 4182]|uniref:Uncharacterized protein n=1 Tax=Tulasnella calospora MUT 4182 TaxID=1051891 RepID=A0A0C3Q2G8_9AGAM|nr:hypothetical protein M407DRAFT_27836 [Tulasnella calospora MUT 4182]